VCLRACFSAWAERKVSSSEPLNNWGLVCSANFIGAAGLVILVFLSGHLDSNRGAVSAQNVKSAAAKCNLPFREAFFRGVLCNILVCMAARVALAGRSVIGKVVVIIFPVFAFVAAGFEHSIANMYFIAMGLMIKTFGDAGAAADAITWFGFLSNLVGWSITLSTGASQVMCK
jgi:formate transporter